MEEFIDGHIVAPSDFDAAGRDASEFGLGGGYDRKAAGEVMAKRLADQLGIGAVLGFADPFKFLQHYGGQRNGQGLAGSHRYDLVRPSLTG